MKTPLVLVLTSAAACAHDYGGDALVRGFTRLAADGIIDLRVFPEAPHRHMALGELRDDCQIDSDTWMPRALFADLPMSADLVVSTSIHAPVVQVPAATPLVAINYGDDPIDQRHIFAHRLGRLPDLYFQREQPMPADTLWLPLSVPLERIRPVAFKPRYAHPRLFYRGSNHNWQADGPRRMMQHALLRSAAAAHCTIDLQESQRGHAPPEVYREWLWQADVSVIWNSWRDGPAEFRFIVWDSHRFWDSLALGCAVIAEAPLRLLDPEIPASWVTSPDEVGPAAEELLLGSLASLRKRQWEQQQAMLRGHTAEHRALAVLDAAGIAHDRWRIPHYL